ncbi:MAG TPA: acetamidase/formamidase family protein [Jatrophihabitantaceae bacterium]|jgi:acetamidase/formamidase|nr:acetamidase/formamidase family protein [Jatrophihabitantaceae bacterium]
MDWSIEARGSALHGVFDRAISPVLTIEAGDTVRAETLDAWWSAGPYTGGAPDERARVPEHTADAGHALTGPIAIRGAVPGRTLAVRIDSVTPGTYGATVTGGRPTVFNVRSGIESVCTVHAWELDVDALTGRNQFGHTVALRPFMGVMGVAPAAPGPHSTIPPRRTGGNLDCKELVAGSTLYLPIAVDGALFSVGDGHAAQGDGEVAGTAIECPMTVELTFDVVDLPIDTPVADTPAGWVTMGVADTLDDACYRALNAMYDLMQRRFELDRADAVALASVVVDTRVTQIVNQVVGVHAVLPHDAVR